MTTLCLDYTDDLGTAHTFRTADAEWQGERWNGYPAPKLPKWQDYLLGLLIGEDHGQPSLRTEADGVEESDYVHADGLCWDVDEA